MKKFKINDFSFHGLSNYGKPLAVVRSIAYLVSLVDSQSHEILKPTLARMILNLIFVKEEQVTLPSALLTWQQDCIPTGFYPQTPAMLTKEWSPIAAMLETGLMPLHLRRSRSIAAIATGIWKATTIEKSKPIKDCKTDPELFWAIMNAAFHRAKERGMFVSVIAQPGWSYESNVGSLNRWSVKKVAEADRILWKRTPMG